MYATMRPEQAFNEASDAGISLLVDADEVAECDARIAAARRRNLKALQDGSTD